MNAPLRPAAPLRAPGKTVILGAGAAGLAVAHELSEGGVDLTVIERNAFVGGLCRTVRYKGYAFDLGGHRWFSKNEDLNAWLRRLMGDELVLVKRISRIYYDRKYYLYPIDIVDLFRRSSLLVMAHAGLVFIWATVVQLLRARPPANMREAYIAQFGSKLYDMFFRRYTEKVWGLPCEKLSSDWVSQRTKGLSIWTLLKDAVGRKQPAFASLIDQFMYPRDGFVRIPERMAEQVVGRGGEVIVAATASRVIYHGPNQFELHYRCGGQEHKVDCETLVSSMPLGRLVQMLSPAPGAAVVAAARALQFRALVTVNLILARERVSTDTWLYVQDEEVLFGRLHEPKNWSAAMVPEPGCTSLVLECFCSRGDAIWNMADEDIVQRCVDDLEQRLGLIAAGDLKDYAIVRTTDAYPVYDLAYQSNLAVIHQFLAGFEGLHILGRSGSFRYNNSDHSIEMGLIMGRRLLGEQLDPMAVNLDPHYHEMRSADEADSANRYVLRPAPLNPTARPSERPFT
ncbi:FAD-dependent oxidoreductase [Massilia sp. DWR3-1-1]|uniref:FAD-dependent oxidoreductase n=1 Tax=Massilia sp. DWR3-1-1 TaxID=2804559 RepID=UPI003CFA8AB1